MLETEEKDSKARSDGRKERSKVVGGKIEIWATKIKRVRRRWDLREFTVGEEEFRTQETAKNV